MKTQTLVTTVMRKSAIRKPLSNPVNVMGDWTSCVM
jgi:hypothetical protein